MTDPAHAPPAGGDAIIARADFQYRWRVYAFFVLIFGYGLLSARDGFINYPRQNEQWRQMEAAGQTPPHARRSDLDIQFNRTLGVALPVLGLALLAWLLYRSRGRYELAGNALHVPGHPAVPLDAIRTLDKSRWERKGIAAVEYERPGAAGTATLYLRDMVYQRTPTDRIVDRIEAHLAPAAAAQTADAPSPSAPAVSPAE